LLGSRAYVHTYLLNHLHASDLRLVGLSATLSEFKVYQLNQPQQEANENMLSKMRNNFVYIVNNLNGRSYAICLLFNQLKPSEMYDWINQLAEHVEFKDALLLTAENRTAYFGLHENQFPLVKYISSDKTQMSSLITRLEQPNIIKGLSAAVIHFCLLKSIPFMALVCYTSSSLKVDLVSINALASAVKSLLGETGAVFIDNDRSKKALLSLERLETSTSNLYM